MYRVTSRKLLFVALVLAPVLSGCGDSGPGGSEPVAALSGCTISPAAESKAVGSNTATTFTVSCSSGTPTSYAWVGGGAGATGADTSSYTTDSNLTGAGSPYTIAVTVGNGVASVSASATLSVSNMPAPTGCKLSGETQIATGTTSQFTVSACTPTDGLAYAWELDGVAVGKDSAYTTSSSLAAGSHALKVTVTNGGGSKVLSATLTVADVLVSCSTSDFSTAALTVEKGSSVKYSNTVSGCNFTPAYVWEWRLPSASSWTALAGCAGASCDLNTAAGGNAESWVADSTYDVRVSQKDGSTLVKQAQASVAVTKVPPPVCTTSANQTVKLTANYFAQHKHLPNKSIAFKFNSGALGAQVSFTTTNVTGTSTNGSTNRVVAINQCPGDFHKMGTSCALEGTAASANLDAIAGMGKFSYCTLQPNTDYYFNIHGGRVDGSLGSTQPTIIEECTISTGCAFWIQFSQQ